MWSNVTLSTPLLVSDNNPTMDMLSDFYIWTQDMDNKCKPANSHGKHLSHKKPDVSDMLQRPHFH